MPGIYGGDDIGSAFNGAFEWLRPGKRLTGKVTVPRVSGMSAAEAEDELTTLGLKFDFNQMQSHPPPTAGLVVTQSPEPGIRVRVGSLVTLTLWHPDPC